MARSDLGRRLGGSIRRKASDRDLGLLFMLLCLLIGVGASTALADEGEAPSQEASSFVPGWTSEEAREEALQKSDPEALDSPTDPEAAATMPHDDLGRVEASDLLTAVFGEVLNEASGIYDELEAERFNSDYTAVVAPEGSDGEIDEEEQPGLLTSLLPLRVESDEGVKAPVDLDLQQGDGELQPRNPLVEVGIPSNLDQGISLPEVGVTIDLAGTPAERAPTNLKESTAFYPNVATDSDLAVLPIPTGFETSAVLRTPDAPLAQTYELTLPLGAHLDSAKDGGAAVVKGDETLLSIRPPSALDANGDSVPVDLIVRGNSVEILTSPSPEASFPILVDPIFETYYWDLYPGDHSPEWIPVDGPCLIAQWEMWASPGMDMYSCSKSWTTPGSQATWNYYVPRFFTDMADKEVKERPTSYIKNMTLSDLSFFSGESMPWQRDPSLTMGIWSEAYGRWVSVATQFGSEGPLNNRSVPLQNKDSVVDAKNGGISLSSGEAFLPSQRNVVVGQATVEISDNDYPRISESGDAPQWVDSGPSSPIFFNAYDKGLGVRSIWANAKAINGETKSISTVYKTCDGSARNPCPRTWTSSGGPTATYDPSVMPQGEDWVTLNAVDPVAHLSSADPEHPQATEVRVKVDHSAPKLALSGTATEQSKVGTGLANYTLSYSAEDGNNEAAVASTPFGEGVTKRPMGIATDGEGNIWAADRENNRVEKFDATGKFLLQFGSLGTGNGQFNDPRALTVSPNGNIWVSEIGNRRVQQFKPNGEFVSKIALPATSEPYGIAAGPGGVLWIADTYNHKVYQYSEAGTLLGEVRGNVQTPTGPTTLSGPIGVTTDPAGNVWVVDNATNRLTKFDATGKFVVQFGVAGTGNGQLSGPAFATVAPSGNLLVGDSGNNRIQVFQPNGTYLRKFGEVGVGSGQFTEPRGLALNTSGTLFVADSGNHRIARWAHADNDAQSGVKKVEVKVDSEAAKTLYEKACADRDCKTSGEWPFEAGKYPNGPHTIEVIATDGVGRKTTKTQALTLNHDATAPRITLSGSMTEQATLGTTLPRYLLKLSASDSAIGDGPLAFNSSFGSSGSGSGQFSHPGDVAVDPKGNLWVTDASNNRLQKFTAAGGVLAQYGSVGSGKGMLSTPSGLAIDSKGNVWVADTGNSRIEQFNEKGEFVSMFGKEVNKTKVEAAGTEAQKNVCTAVSGNTCQAGKVGTGNGQFAGPRGIALTAGGNLMVVDTGNSRVQKISPEGEYLAKIGTAGSGAAQLKEPQGVAVAPDGSIWVADAGNNRIQQWSSAFEFLRQVGTAGAGNGQFQHPDAIEADAGGNLFVVDQGGARIEVFNSTGGYITQFGTPGSAAGQFSLSDSVGLALDGKGSVWITDANNNRVQKWSPSDGVQTGIVSSVVKVDGKVVDSTSPGCPSGTCELTREWTLNSTAYEAKQHVVEVTATDGFGLSTTKTLTINIAKDNKSPQLTATKTLYTAPEGWLEQKAMPYEASATDAGGYGLTSIALKVDGVVVKNVSQTCPNGACTISLGSGSIDLAGYSGGAHPAELIATDGAGNVAKKLWTINVDPKGVITSSEAEDTLEAFEDTTGKGVLLPEPATENPLAEEAPPILKESGAVIHSEGAPVETIMTPTPGEGFKLETSEGQVGITPLGIGGSPTPIKVAPNGKAGVAGNTGSTVDTVVRPIYDGGLVFQQIRTVAAPEEYAWTVNLHNAQVLKQIDSRTAEVYQEDEQEVIHPSFGIRAEYAHDAVGSAVPTELVVSGTNLVTLKVAYKAGNPAAGGAPFVYPITAGTGWEGGFVTEFVDIPDEPPPGELNDPASEFTGWMSISPPTPIDGEDAEATISGAHGVKKYFVYVECSHNSIVIHPPLYAEGVYREECGSPFHNDPGHDVALRAAYHGKYFIDQNVKVWHEGKPTDGIGCVAEAEPIGATGYQKRAHVDKCVWWGLTADGGGSSAPYGKHITPVGQFTSESRGSCGDNCPGPKPNNPWVQHEFPPMAYYLWADGHIGFHETTCIDCY